MNIQKELIKFINKQTINEDNIITILTELTKEELMDSTEYQILLTSIRLKKYDKFKNDLQIVMRRFAMFTKKNDTPKEEIKLKTIIVAFNKISNYNFQ